MNNSALMDASAAGRSNLVEKFIAAGADVNKQGKQNMSALHLAARKGHTTVVRLLLAARADATKESQVGNALHLARKNGNVELLEALGGQGESSERNTKIVDLDAAQRAALFLD